MRKVVVGLCAVLGLQRALIGQLLPAGATPQLLTGGYRFTEGPLYDHAGGLYFSDLDMTHADSFLFHYDLASHIATMVDPDSGGTNGTYFNNNGQIVASERDRQRMTLRSVADVSVVQQVLATNWQGKVFNGPNDVVVDAQGGMYFTDPDFENRNSMPEAIYYLSSAGTLSQVVTGISRPNGVVLSPNGNTLYIAGWAGKFIMSYNVSSPGVLTNASTFVTMTGSTDNPDGITIDPSGNVYASLRTKVRAWSSAGTVLMNLTIPQSSTNVEIGGPNGKTLFITAGTGVYGIDLNVATIASSWNVNSNGNWLSDNWTGGNPPNGVDHVATFGSAITAPRVITVNVPRYVGAINFNNTTSYTIAGSSTVTLDVSTGQAAINVLSGSHTISAPLVLNDDTTFTVTPAASTLAITSNLQATGKALTKAGDGTAQVENLRSASLNIAAGTLRISAKGTPNSPGGTSVLNSATISTGAQLDLTNNSMIIDYSGSVGTLMDDTRQHLLSGRLFSSSANANLSLGYADNATLGLSTFGGQSVDPTSLLVKFTYAGDTDLDGDVDIADLRNLALGWQTTGVWTNGDFDYNGIIDARDLGLLARNWQAGVTGPGLSLSAALASLGLGAAAVPEPGVALCLLIAAASLVHRR